jgi:hypothetical protein
METDRGNTGSSWLTLTRREALTYLGGGAAVALLTMGPDAVRAQGTPRPAREQPNHFVLSGGEMMINYGSTSETGRPVFSYQGPHGDRNFEGDEIEVADGGSLGQLVTVLVAQRPDADVTRLTLLLPEINLLPDEPTPLTTLAILTTHLTTIAGPALIRGALQKYEAVTVEGTADLVMS